MAEISDPASVAGSRLRHFLVASLLLVALTAVGLTPVVVKEMARRADERRDLNSFGAVLASSLEQQLERSLSSTFALASLIRHSSDGNIRDFDSIAAKIIEVYGGIDSLELAPGGVVLQSYPLGGNEQEIGHDLVNDPVWRAESLKAIDSRSLTLAGPFELLQGGTAVTGTLPVFVPDGQGGERFWGFTIALIQLPNLLEATGLSIVAEQGHQYWLSRIHPDSGVRQVFAASGESQIQESAMYYIDVPNGAWELYLRKTDEISPLWLASQFILVVVLSAMVSILVYTRLQRTAARQVAQRTLDREINERTRLEAAELKLARELSVVDEVAQIITSTLDIEEIYEKFATEVKKLVYFDRMSINICDKDISQASMRHSVGLDVPGRDDGDTWSLDQTPFRDALISGKTILRSDTSDRKYYTDQKYLDVGFRSMMLVPLTYQGTPIGCIALRSKQVGAYSFAEQIILERLAQQIAPAVANADLFEQSKRAEEDQRRWGEETSALAAIGRTVSASLDINDVYERLGEEIRKIIPFDRFTIGLVDHENGTTSPTWALGSGVPSRRTGDEIPLAGAFSGEVVRTRLPVLLEMETEAEVGRTFPLMMPSYRAGLRSFMAVPLIEHDAVIGVLRVGSNTLGIYSPRLLNLLERIGNQIAGTVANAQLYTDLKRAEDELRQSEVRYRDLYDNTPVMMHSIDGEGNLVSVNDFWLEALGYERGEIIGRRYTGFFTEGSRRRAVEVDLPKFRETGVACDIEYQMQKKTGDVMDVLLSGVSQQNKSGLNHYSNAFIVDVTDRKEAGDKINASLQEKEVLLKEINHRVKNNLQIIISLLSLQSRDIKDEQTLHSFEVSRNRIRAMALVHDKLYQSDDLARIDFGQYINSLALDLRSSYGLSSRDVNLNIDVDSILLGVDTAIPCGVIVNELVANSLRHAFPGNRPGEISIRFCLADGQYMMVYKDDGVGFPDDLDIHNSSSMGLTIINALTGQLGGNIERGRKGGSDLIITFPAK